LFFGQSQLNWTLEECYESDDINIEKLSLR